MPGPDTFLTLLYVTVDDFGKRVWARQRHPGLELLHSLTLSPGMLCRPEQGEPAARPIVSPLAVGRTGSSPSARWAGDRGSRIATCCGTA